MRRRCDRCESGIGTLESRYERRRPASRLSPAAPGRDPGTRRARPRARGRRLPRARRAIDLLVLAAAALTLFTGLARRRTRGHDRLARGGRAPDRRIRGLRRLLRPVRGPPPGPDAGQAGGGHPGGERHRQRRRPGRRSRPQPPASRGLPPAPLPDRRAARGPPSARQAVGRHGRRHRRSARPTLPPSRPCGRSRPRRGPAVADPRAHRRASSGCWPSSRAGRPTSPRPRGSASPPPSPGDSPTTPPRRA